MENGRKQPDLDTFLFFDGACEVDSGNLIQGGHLWIQCDLSVCLLRFRVPWLSLNPAICVEMGGKQLKTADFATFLFFDPERPGLFGNLKNGEQLWIQCDLLVCLLRFRVPWLSLNPAICVEMGGKWPKTARFGHLPIFRWGV